MLFNRLEETGEHALNRGPRQGLWCCCLEDHKLRILPSCATVDRVWSVWLCSYLSAHLHVHLSTRPHDSPFLPNKPPYARSVAWCDFSCLGMGLPGTPNPRCIIFHNRKSSRTSCFPLARPQPHCDTVFMGAQEGSHVTTQCYPHHTSSRCIPTVPCSSFCFFSEERDGDPPSVLEDGPSN